MANRRRAWLLYALLAALALLALGVIVTKVSADGWGESVTSTPATQPFAAAFFSFL